MKGFITGTIYLFLIAITVTAHPFTKKLKKQSHDKYCNSK